MFDLLVFEFQVLANDSDILGNAVIVYSLIPDVNNHYLAFDINKDNGSITTAKQLDREDLSEYLLMVKAEDSASQDQTRYLYCKGVCRTKSI